MTEEDEPEHPRLYEILETITPQKWENYELITDPHKFTTGIFSHFYACTCVNKDNGEATHIAFKVVPLSKIINSCEGIYRNEVYFYSTIFPALYHFQRDKGVKHPFINLPRYLGGYLSKKKEFLILENQKVAGYILYDKRLYLDSDHLTKIFKIYGKFHALSFVFKQEYPERFKSMTSNLVDKVKLLDNSGLIESMQTAYSAAISYFDPQLEADIIKKLKRVDNIRKTIINARQYEGDYTCLTHGDCRLNNMLFKYKKSGEVENVKLIDFSLVHLNTPVHDLCYFFYSGASKTDIDNLDYYLNIYYQSLSSFYEDLGGDIEKKYQFDTLKEEWKKYGILGIITGIGMWVGKLMDKNEIIALLENQCRRDENLERRDSKISILRKEDSFRERARDICLHAVEYGII